MKKAILITLLVIVVGGGIFYLGWINVPQGSFGVLYSTFTGTINRPIEGGKINWYWQKVIPKTYSIRFFEKKPVVIETVEEIPLPGYQDLKEYGNFLLKFNVTSIFTLNFDAARALTEQNLIDNYIDRFSEIQSSRAKKIASDFILKIFKRTPDINLTYSELEKLKESIENEINKVYNSYKIKNVGVEVSFENIPSIEGYRRAYKAYLKTLDLLAKAKEKQAELEATIIEKQNLIESSLKEKEAQEESKLLVLKKYGELFREYPELLKYMYLERFGSNANVVVIPIEPETGFPKLLENLPYGRGPGTEEALPKEPISPLPELKTPELEEKLPEKPGETAPAPPTIKEEKPETSGAEKAETIEPTQQSESTKEFEEEKSFIDKLKFWQNLFNEK